MWLNREVFPYPKQAPWYYSVHDRAFYLDSSMPIPLLPEHAWGIAYIPDNKGKLNEDYPVLTYDPRARGFGFNRVCDSCHNTIGLGKGLSQQTPIFDNFFEKVKK